MCIRIHTHTHTHIYLTLEYNINLASRIIALLHYLQAFCLFIVPSIIYGGEFHHVARDGLLLIDI